MTTEGIVNCLDLSTAHVPEAVVSTTNINAPLYVGTLRCIAHTFGWVIWPADGAEVPEWFKPILVMALRHECVVILFDCDAEVIPDLPVYQWY